MRALICLECEETLEFPRHDHCYLLHVRTCWKTEVHWLESMRVLTHEIWCAGCNRPSYAERVPTRREFENACGLRKTDDMTRDGRLDIEVTEDELVRLETDTLLCLAQALEGRRSPGACLYCGGRAYLPLRFSRGFALGLRHAGCGGLFRADYGWWWQRGAPRWYGLDGLFVTESWEFFDALDESDPPTRQA